jgi:hypothetical protein
VPLKESERLTAYYNSIQPLCPEIYEGFIGYDRFNRVRSDQTIHGLDLAALVRGVQGPRATVSLLVSNGVASDCLRS